MSPHDPAKMRVHLAFGWGCLAALAVLLAWWGARTLVVCDATLALPEPSEWHEWPLVSAEEQPRVCRGSTGAMESGQWMRRATGGDSFVIATLPIREEEPRERFVAAFRTTGRTVAAERAGAVAGFAVLGLSFVVMIVGLGSAHVFRRRARALAALESRDLEFAPASYRSPTAPPGASPRAVRASRRASQEDRAVRAIRSALVVVACAMAVGAARGSYLVIRDVLVALL